MMTIIRSPILIGALWLAVVGFGLIVMAKYEASPGISGMPPADLPQELASYRSAGKFTLVMFAHPRCPCTRASVSELAGLMTRCHNKLESIVCVLSPRSMPKGWERTDIWEKAAGIPGVQVIPDLDGMRARQFNAPTSGQAALYDKQGKLIFAGGITSARGRIGNSQGVKIITSLVNQESPAIEPNAGQATLVFGCPLHDPLPKPR
jgi:hypothetical protein